MKATPVLPFEHPLPEALKTYTKRIFLLMGVGLANIVLFGGMHIVLNFPHSIVYAPPVLQIIFSVVFFGLLFVVFLGLLFALVAAYIFISLNVIRIWNPNPVVRAQMRLVTLVICILLNLVFMIYLFINNDIPLLILCLLSEIISGFGIKVFYFPGKRFIRLSKASALLTLLASLRGSKK